MNMKGILIRLWNVILIGIYWPITLFGEKTFTINISDKVAFVGNTIWLSWESPSRCIILLDEYVFLGKSKQIPVLIQNNTPLKATRLKGFRREHFLFEIALKKAHFDYRSIPSKVLELPLNTSVKARPKCPSKNVRLKGASSILNLKNMNGLPTNVSLPNPTEL